MRYCLIKAFLMPAVIKEGGHDQHVHLVQSGSSLFYSGILLSVRTQLSKMFRT